ncbi:uncharacterized protein BJX67DRAFT_388828 [Aspergillus lucknowensis]|uniref:Protein kinase domain-containing protein n=1 Tax=Aspergillus lucknowensis TaxID=176173 RepID=A0ABR4LNP8_9EURO
MSTGKVVTGSLKSLGLPQVLMRQSSLLRDNESPWDTFRKTFTCDLAGPVIIAVHRSRPSHVVAIRQYAAEEADRMLHLFTQIQHDNIIMVKECYRFRGTVYARMDDLPLTLEHVVWCGSVYPTHQQLSLIVGQTYRERILDGLSCLVSAGFEHMSLSCSNILLDLAGNVKIGALEFCQEQCLENSQPRMIKSLASIIMILMQKHEKDEREDGLLMGVEDTDRWPLESSAFRFLLMTSSAGSIEELRQHAFVCPRPPKGELVDLARFALIAARISYSRIG